MEFVEGGEGEGDEDGGGEETVGRGFVAGFLTF